jgi:hypothetical protein
MASVIKQMKDIKAKVKYLLQQYPLTRDNDSLLISYIYYYEIGEPALTQMNALEFLKLFSKGDLPSTESIRRMRAKIQEEYPALRGLKYKERHESSQSVRQNINKI